VPPGDAQADEIVNHHQFAFDQLGPRVPALIISPLIPKNLIDHRTYDHTSVLATAERLLGLNPLTERDRHANSLHTLIQLPEARTDTPARLRTPAGHQAPPRAKKARTRPSRPDASIDEGQIAGFVYAAFTQDIEISPPDQRPAIRARVAGIRTHQQAFDYIRDVGARVAVARQRRPARIAS
jgi:phospholipase C